MTGLNGNGRLSTLAAAMVIARRDFFAILLSRSFLFFLIGPLFPLFVGGLASGVGRHVDASAGNPVLGVAMSARDVDALLAARDKLGPDMGGAAPDMVVLERLKPGIPFNAGQTLRDRRENVAAVLTGTLAAPVLTGPQGQIDEWTGPVRLLAAEATGHGPAALPPVKPAPTATSTVNERSGRMHTAQAGQTLLFLLTMLLAGMVLSNLVEEKANKIIEILAAAIPMDAVFLGKLFAMLAVSFVGIAVWSSTIGALFLISGQSLANLATPAVGWPMFIALGIAYFAMGYLLLGSVFLTVGSMASTVREVQTLSMPVTMMQLLVFFFASYTMAMPGSMMETAAAAVPFSSPFVMLARAALDPGITQHLVALVWQAMWVGLFIRFGARLFRHRVMKSGPAGGGKRRGGGLFRRAKAA